MHEPTDKQKRRQSDQVRGEILVQSNIKKKRRTRGGDKQEDDGGKGNA
jgi:hypothetical protein